MGIMARDLTVLGRALAVRARSDMVTLLLDGSARPASELAAHAGVSASTASEHLAVLQAAGILDVVSRGRRRFFAMANADIAALIESIGALCPEIPSTSFRQSAAARRMALARMCYDHLAGRLGVTVTQAMIDQDWLAPDWSGLTAAGVEALERLDIPAAARPSSRRVWVRSCPDWTERLPHLAGECGANIAAAFHANQWVTRHRTGRGLALTLAGRNALESSWGVQLDEERYPA